MAFDGVALNGPTELERFVYRSVFLPVRFGLYVLDLLFLLLTRPKLAVCLWRLGLASVRSSPYRWPSSERARDAFSRSGQSLSEALYGETPVLAAVRLLKHAGLGRDGRFWDLGAGRGRTLLAARWLGAEARGLELVGEHVEATGSVLATVGAVLEEGSATDARPADVTHVFVSWQGLSESARARITTILEGFAPGTKVIAVGEPLSSAAFESLFETWALLSWGFERVYAYSLR